MNVKHFCCSPAANNSELTALHHLKSRLQGLPGEDIWILLSNLNFSVTHQLQSDEIDLVVIGPPGVRVVEVKHWDGKWINRNSDLVEREADRVTAKARKIGTTLRKVLPDLPFVVGVFLLTQPSAKLRTLSTKNVRGVNLLTLSDWKTAIGLDANAVLNRLQTELLSRKLEPKSAIALDGSLRRLAGYVNLELQTSKEEQFHRIYKGAHSTRKDRVALHLYDLTARTSGGGGGSEP